MRWLTRSGRKRFQSSRPRGPDTLKSRYLRKVHSLNCGLWPVPGSKDTGFAGLADDDAGCIVETKFLRRAPARPRQAPSDVGLGRKHHTVRPARAISILNKPATMPSARTLIAQMRTSQPMR